MEDYEKNIEIPFGANDSELGGFEYTIPEGYEAEIKDGKAIVRKTESEDEKIRKEIINYFKCQSRDEPTRKDIHNKWLAWLEKQGEQKPAWSEEDEINLDWLITVCERIHYKSDPQVSPDSALGLKNWLKSLKDRVQPQPKQEWSEEDEEIVEALNDYVKNLDILFSEIKIGDKDILSKEFREKVQLWLKSLRPQNTWKPSDEQLNNILDVLSFDNCTPKRRKLLESLYEQLRKLRKE